MIRGIDVSKHNGNVNFEKVKQNGIDFVILRIGYRGYLDGSLNIDPTFIENYNKAKKRGLYVGGYFFSQAKNKNEGIAEREYCLKIIKDNNIYFDYPVYIDTEGANNNHTGRADNISSSNRTDALIGFCSTMEEKGFYTGIYRSESWLKAKVIYNSLTMYDKWIAKWSNFAPSEKYGKYNMWQYSNNYKIDGTRFDISNAYIDFAKVIKNKGLNKVRKQKIYDININNISVGDMITFKKLCEDLKLTEFSITEKEV